jgi:MFS family permease
MPVPADADTPAPVGANPWPLRPFFGKHDVLPAAARRVLQLVAIGMFFENYDISLINAALPQIAADLAIAPEDTGFYLSAIRFGGIGAFLILPFADRIGRKRLFLIALLGMSLATVATGLSPTPAVFTLAQCVARMFMLTAAALALVIVVEEFPAHQRGAGLGLLALLGGLGYGLCAALYALVEVIPFGWRSLYAVGVAPAVLLPFLHRSLLETRRFVEHRESRTAAPATGSFHAWLDPIRRLVRENRRRAIAVGCAAFFTAAGSIGFFQYTSLFLQSAHGWTPGGYSLLVVSGGLIGVFGSIMGGRGSDRWGRRRIGFATLICAPPFAIGFLFGPENTLVVLWGLFVFCSSAGAVIIRALSAELFPTSHRGTATGWMMLVQTLGWTLGLLLVGLGSDSAADLGWTIACLSLAVAVGGIALLAVPETHGRDLESINDEPSRV